MRHLISLEYFSQEEIYGLINDAILIKRSPMNYSTALQNKTLLMFFEKPSLRTRISFEVGMSQLGGHAIFADFKDLPIGKKESVSDTAKVSSKYVDFIMARMNNQKIFENLVRNSEVPVINALTDFYHPCQILSDLLTIHEKKDAFEDLKLTFFGDCNNNVAHSLLYGCSIMGINITLACPNDLKYRPNENILEKSKEIAKHHKSIVEITDNPIKAAKNSDIVYTDTWMSYGTLEEENEKRIADLKKFQVNESLMHETKFKSIFMHCLPAQRGYEVTTEVIDGPRSVIFDQAENRLHMQKAILLKLHKWNVEFK